jgi:hypothetical protein
MSRQPQLMLSENHRRVVSVLLQQAENACEEIERWLNRQSGTMSCATGDFSPLMQEQFRRLVQQARLEIAHCASSLGLSRAVVSRRQAVLALVTKMLSDLEEVHSPGLRAYGRISPEAEHQVDICLDRLCTIFEQMAGLCIRD